MLLENWYVSTIISFSSLYFSVFSHFWFLFLTSNTYNSTWASHVHWIGGNWLRNTDRNSKWLNEAWNQLIHCFRLLGLAIFVLIFHGLTLVAEKLQQFYCNWFKSHRRYFNLFETCALLECCCFGFHYSLLYNRRYLLR